MNKKLPVPVYSALRKLGRDIKEARLRRRITMQLLSERAGITRVTLSKIEQGDASVSMGNYASVLFSLGLIERMGNIVDVDHDLVGKQLAAESLPKRVRHKKYE